MNSSEGASAPEGQSELYGEEYLRYQTERSALRKFVRRIYLWQVRRHVRGKVLDFGCGAGEHLATFPGGSHGLEVNPQTVEYCRRKGLSVSRYHPETDDYRLLDIPENTFETLVISHVLEHLETPEEVFRKLAASCRRLGIGRLFATVPGAAGFAHDATHRTYIDRDYLFRNNMHQPPGYTLTKFGYFPVNIAAVGRVFTYNEMYWVCDRVD